jgi:broad specificity phosphatase PhoE
MPAPSFDDKFTRFDRRRYVYYNLYMKIKKTIVLVRHGTTANNEQGVWQGRGDFPLNDTGRKEARLLAERLKHDAFDIVYHSPMIRAIETAEIINKNHNAPCKTIPGFVEIDLGEFDGKKHEEIMGSYPEIYQNWVRDIDAPIPGGESFNDIYNRVKPGVDEIMASNHRGILVVAHAMVNRAILGQLMKMDPIPARKFRMDNSAFSKFIVYESPFGNYIAVDSWNNTSHLETPAAENKN